MVCHRQRIPRRHSGFDWGDRTLVALRSIGWRIGGVAVAVLLPLTTLVLCPYARASEQQAGCIPVARIVSIQGVLQILRADQGAWSIVRKLDTVLCQGDVIHAGPRSRAALLISPDTLIRLDQHSTLAVSQTADETIIEFAKDPGLFQPLLSAPNPCGAGYLITRFPRKFRVLTPFINASVEGTEFLVAMRCENAQIAVFEGRLLAQEILASSSRAFTLKEGESLETGTGAPAVVKVLVRPVDAVQWALYYPPLTEATGEEAADQKCDQVDGARRSACLVQRAEHRLRSGRVEEAEGDIQTLLELDMGNGNAYALLSIINVVKNEKAEALELGTLATQRSPDSARSWLALSYAQQAAFELHKALSAAQRAAELSPASSTAQARVAELLMSLGRIREAEAAARGAVAANPGESRGHTVLGFVHLAQTDTKVAREEFLAAIERDSTDPLARLGLGLATIRDGELVAGREHIEIAVALDPTNSLIRSYVGKAYYEENTGDRDRLAAKQFGLAKQLDPKDPTAWLYDAILNQTQNRPVEALADLERSIELNDNRAVYRSRLLLDEDRASRSTSLASVFHDLGFERRAVAEASASLEADVSNYSAHRFLAESYARLERSEFARASEVLQAQLLQPSNARPLPARFAFTDLPTLPGTASPPASINEYSGLFERNGLRFQASGVAGNLDTWGEELLLSGLRDQLTFGFGQFHYQTDGFRPNNDLEHDVYSGFAQLTLAPELSLQVDLLQRETESGDLLLDFDPQHFSSSNRNLVDQNSGRVGLRISPSVGSNILVSYFHGNRTGQLIAPDPTFINLDVTTDDETDNLEVQYLGRFGAAQLILGLRTNETQTKSTEVVDFTPLFGVPCPPFFVCVTELDTRKKEDTAYGQLYLQLMASLGLSVGLAHYKVKQNDFRLEEWSPRLGLDWKVAAGTRVRVAAAESLRPVLPIMQTLEPTQIAGFPQLFDASNFALSRLYAAAVDHDFSSRVRLTLEASRRDIDKPVFTQAFNFLRVDDQREDVAGVHALWLPSSNWSLGAAFIYEHYALNEEDTFFDDPKSVATWSLPLMARFFAASGVFASLALTHVHQEVERLPSSTVKSGEDTFYLVDVALGTRLPARRGAVAVQIKNLFDETFSYYDANFFSLEPKSPRFVPALTVLFSAALAF
jgi:tetratricopeptide (TPR) repeat protein